ncbi:MAG: 2-dehydropantoate 2-reductase [Vicinamibacterales bacterium]
MKIVMFGAGGVGGYFGGRLAQAGCDVSFVARGAHLEALRRDGLRLVSPKGDAHITPVTASADPADLGPADVVFFTVKLYDAEASAAQLAPLIGPDTMVVTLQNGVDAVDIVARHVGRAHTAGGVAYVAAVIDPPGTIRHTALDALIVGELDGAMSPRLLALKAAADRAGFGFTASPHILVDQWSKFARLSVFSAMTAITRSPLGVLRAQPELMAMLERAAWETIAVGRAHGVPLVDGVMDEVLAMMRGMPPQAQSSMLSDLERQRPLELPWLSGAVVRLGREKGVPTPIHEFVATVLSPFVKGGPPAMA